jgi:hypothetical protein
MATPRDWATGYLEQGREDLAALRRLDASTPSTAAMLLQMVFEKLAKSAMLKLGSPLPAVQRSHHVASRLVAVFASNPILLEALDEEDGESWAEVLPLVLELEAAHPAPPVDPVNPKKRLPRPAGTPVLEYPWEDAKTGDIRWPARDLPIAQRFADPAGVELARLVKFAMSLSRKHASLFP